LQEAGVPRQDLHVKRGLSWLEGNQNQAEGFWPSYSLNERLDPASDVGRFMSDAATGFSVLALARAGR
jgi:hypothetical protein